MEQEVASVGAGKVAPGESPDRSVVLQGASEDGEEVVRGEGQYYGARVGELTAALQAFSQMARRVLAGDDDEVVSDSEDVSLRGDGADASGYWSGRVRCRGPKSAGDIIVADRAPVKRKHEECGPGYESELYEDTESDDDSASSSDSDASDSEYERWSRRATSRKRRRGADELYGSILMTDECLPQDTGSYDNELKEMHHLLELQLQASERREAGMKQRMETMMEMMSKHMGHVEKCVCNLEVGAQPQDQILERINLKLEKVMEGFSTLNENLSILSACLSKGLDSQ